MLIQLLFKTINVRLRTAGIATAFIFAVTIPSVLAQSFDRVDPDEVGISSERLERLNAVMQDYVDEGKLPGSVTIVARHGKIAYLEAFGQQDLEAGIPMTENSIFRIASQSKALVSVGVMMLQEQGKLLISDPVGRYLPEFMETTVAVAKDGGGYEIVPAERPISIRDLLTHTSGVSYGNGIASDRWESAGITGWYFADRNEPIRATVARMAALPFNSQPGESFVYGYSLDILGALIEQVSGEALDVFLRTHLFEPLGMNDTYFYLPESKSDRLTVVYSVTQSGSLERAPDPGAMVGQGAYLKGPRMSFSGGAGLLSTAGDYARFLQMLLNGGVLEGRRLLGPKTVDMMTMNQLGESAHNSFGTGTGFGLGFRIIEDLDAMGIPGSVGEFGWGGAYHSTYWVDPEEDLLVVHLTQVIPAIGLDDQNMVRAIVYQALID